MSKNTRRECLLRHTEAYLTALSADPAMEIADDKLPLLLETRESVAITVSVVLGLDLADLGKLATALDAWAPLQRLRAENARLSAHVQEARPLEEVQA